MEDTVFSKGQIELGLLGVWLSGHALANMHEVLSSIASTEKNHRALRASSEVKGTHDNPGPVVHQFGNKFVHLLLFLLHIRDEACELLLESTSHGSMIWGPPMPSAPQANSGAVPC